MNSLYNQLNQNQNLTQNNGNILVELAKSKNPMEALQTLANNNPQIQSTLNMIQQSGKSPKDLFYELAKQRGVDPNQILNMLK